MNNQKLSKLTRVSLREVWEVGLPITPIPAPPDQGISTDTHTHLASDFLYSIGRVQKCARAL